MELRQLRTFEAVVRHGTVTDAAVALGLAPSSVSEQIRTLERSLEVTLFDRGPKGMRLTGAGERMLTWAHRLLSQAEQARREVTEQGAALRLGALESIAATHVPVVLARLSERRPEIGVQVHAEISRDTLLDDVAAGRLDVALLLDNGDTLGALGFEPPTEPLAFLDLAPVPLALVAAPGHSLSGRPDLRPADLRGERLLVNNSPACSFWMAVEQTFDADIERVRAGGVAVMRAWAQQGLGICLLPEFAVATDLDSGSLVRLGLPTPALSLRLVWRADRETLPGLRDILYAASS
ncbi:LysR family transcriptional regulator [Solihabitans fulvus]|uniref:LysR family transcriptional regulator n=1 Tax=Solihabitans fulvus TaxID=1892852 RepID=A0A5B2XWI6_9PSEU|nr:LysR family transcriptional regulator [Solihabitans fulvus]KAA2267054.1 LysR family transcriptional regulator [Solihabitans fulvus]